MSARQAHRTLAERRPVPTVELERVLGRLLDGAGGPVEVLDRRPFPYHSTYPLDELTVRRQDGSQQRLVLKDLSLPPAADRTKCLKPRFLHDPLREIDAYRRILAPEAISAPGCLGVEVDEDRGRYWLFLERLEGDLLWQVGDPAVWRQAAGWLGRLHGRFAGRAATLPRRLLTFDAAYFGRWLERTRKFVRWPESAARRGRDFRWLAGRVQAALEWLARQPVTFLHGEYYPSNIVVDYGAVDEDNAQLLVADVRLVEAGRRGDTTTGLCLPRIRPLDWEMAAVGPGLLDLAALVSGSWKDHERLDLADAYRLGLPEGSRPSVAEIWSALDRCRLLLAMQWLGWAPHWEPPPEHEHDWLATALELADRCKPLPDLARWSWGQGRLGGRRARRLNWGCGGAGVAGWINSDRRQGPGIDIVRDIREGLPLDDASLDYVVSIHALQEVPYADLVPVLEELRRVLVPGGVLRLGLPDLERAMRAYLAGDASYFVVPDDDARTLGGKLVTQIVWYGHSRTPFTFEFVAELLDAAGFRSVSRCTFRETASGFPGIVELDDREPESLFAEALR